MPILFTVDEKYKFKQCPKLHHLSEVTPAYGTSGHGRPFKNRDEMIKKIRSVWDEVAKNKTEIRRAMKQFVPRLNALVDKEGYSIKTGFG